MIAYAVEQPFGAPEFPPVITAFKVQVRVGFDVPGLILACAKHDDDIELVSLLERERWLGLRREIRVEVRGTEWAAASFWRGVKAELPPGLRFEDFIPWW